MGKRIERKVDMQLSLFEDLLDLGPIEFCQNYPKRIEEASKVLSKIKPEDVFGIEQKIRWLVEFAIEGAKRSKDLGAAQNGREGFLLQNFYACAKNLGAVDSHILDRLERHIGQNGCRCESYNLFLNKLKRDICRKVKFNESVNKIKKQQKSSWNGIWLN